MDLPDDRELVKNNMLSGYEGYTKGPPCGRTGPHFHVKFKAGGLTTKVDPFE